MMIMKKITNIKDKIQYKKCAVMKGEDQCDGRLMTGSSALMMEKKKKKQICFPFPATSSSALIIEKFEIKK